MNIQNFFNLNENDATLNLDTKSTVKHNINLDTR